MRDYADIISQIRIAAIGVKKQSNRLTLMQDAADAIEELLAERNKYKAYFDNVSSLPDCNVCLKQSVCVFVPAWGENTRINCPLALTEPPKEVQDD